MAVHTADLEYIYEYSKSTTLKINMTYWYKYHTHPQSLYLSKYNLEVLFPVFYIRIMNRGLASILATDHIHYFINIPFTPGKSSQIQT